MNGEKKKQNSRINPNHINANDLGPKHYNSKDWQIRQKKTQLHASHKKYLVYIKIH